MNVHVEYVSRAEILIFFSGSQFFLPINRILVRIEQFFPHRSCRNVVGTFLSDQERCNVKSFPHPAAKSFELKSILSRSYTLMKNYVAFCIDFSVFHLSFCNIISLFKTDAFQRVFTAASFTCLRIC